MKKTSRWKLLGFTLVAITLGIVLLEGALNLIWLAVDLSAEPEKLAAESEGGLEKAFEFDPDLGWVGIASSQLPDYYGTGLGVSFNSQRVRGTKEHPIPKPDDIFRILCLGDSFTFGHGVADETCYPAQLAKRGSKLDVVNMAVPGYSVGQSWLRWQRDGAAFDPDLTLAALICMDIHRMRIGVRRARNLAPKFRLVEDKIEVYDRLSSAPASDTTTKEMKTGEILQFISRKNTIARTLKLAIPPRQFGPENVSESAFDELFDTACAIYVDMNRQCKEAGGDFALVLIPTITDISREYDRKVYTKVEDQLRELAAREGFPFLGLREIFVNRSEEEWRSLYLDPAMDKSEHCGARGHALIAEEIHLWLMASVPSYAESFASRETTQDDSVPLGQYP